MRPVLHREPPFQWRPVLWIWYCVLSRLATRKSPPVYPRFIFLLRFFRPFPVRFSGRGKLAFSSLAIVALALLFGLSGQASAIPGVSLSSPVRTGGDAPWHLTADRLESLDDGVIVEASGDVVLTRGQDYLKADFARYYTATDWVFVQGNVSVRLGRDELSAAEAEFDLKSNTGWLKNGSVFMAGPHITFTGEEVVKHWGDRYTFQEAKVTACDGPTPAWSLAADQAVVEIDGYATLSHATFQVLDQGVLYAPWMALPAKTTRQTGLLMPDYGFSDEHGFFATVPWYWAIDKSRDLTVYGSWFEKNGLMPSVEYRSHVTDTDKTWLGLDYLHDENAKSYIRDDRFWLRGMGDGQIGLSGWKYKYDLDYVSDGEFLTDFHSFMTGYDDSRDTLLKMFGRDLPTRDKNRVTSGFVYRDWERFGVTAGLRYEENPFLRQLNYRHVNDTIVQKLPELNAYLYKGRLLRNVPLEIEGEASTAYMYREEGTSGMRTEIHPVLSLPVDLKYGTLIASGGLRQTLYHSTSVSGNTPLVVGEGGRRDQTGESRTIPEVDVQAYTSAQRVWKFTPDLDAEQVGRYQLTALRHTLQPRVSYSWVPNVDQEKNPFYDEDDRILPSSVLNLSLTNLVTLRRELLSSGSAEDGQRSGLSLVDPVYSEIARVRLSGGYDFREARRKKFRDVLPRRPILDLALDTTLRPLDWLSLWNQTYFSMHGEGITRNDVGVTFTNRRWGSWSVGYSRRNGYYDYQDIVKYDNIEDMLFDKPLELVTNALELKLNQRWSLGFSSQDDLLTKENYERNVRLTYSDPCFRVSGYYSSERDGKEQSIRLRLELLGLS